MERQFRPKTSKLQRRSKTIRENGSYDKGEILASGISHVLVNGVRIIVDGAWKGTLPGRALRLNAQ